MRFNGATDAQRVATSIEKNKILDSEPTGVVFGYTKEKLMRLRTRD